MKSKKEIHDRELEQRFDQMTLELLRYKYYYYVQDNPKVSDYEYDMLEKKWTALGMLIGLNMDNYGHWVGFDMQHPMANDVLNEMSNNIGEQ